MLSPALLPPGGAFALYSLLKRAGNFRTFGQAMEADKELSRYSLTKVPHRSSQTQSQPIWQTRMSRSRVYQGVRLQSARPGGHTWLARSRCLAKPAACFTSQRGAGRPAPPLPALICPLQQLAGCLLMPQELQGHVCCSSSAYWWHSYALLELQPWTGLLMPSTVAQP